MTASYSISKIKGWVPGDHEDVPGRRRGQFVKDWIPQSFTDQLHTNGQTGAGKSAGYGNPGKPARLVEMVYTSLRYMEMGHHFSPKLKRGCGEVGVRMASTSANAFSKS